MLAAVNEHLFLLNSKPSWAQNESVNANKVFLTKDTKNALSEKLDTSANDSCQKKE